MDTKPLYFPDSCVQALNSDLKCCLRLPLGTDSAVDNGLVVALAACRFQASNFVGIKIVKSIFASWMRWRPKWKFFLPLKFNLLWAGTKGPKVWGARRQTSDRATSMDFRGRRQLRPFFFLLPARKATTSTALLFYLSSYSCLVLRVCFLFPFLWATALTSAYSYLWAKHTCLRWVGPAIVPFWCLRLPLSFHDAPLLNRPGQLCCSIFRKSYKYWPFSSSSFIFFFSLTSLLFLSLLPPPSYTLPTSQFSCPLTLSLSLPPPRLLRLKPPPHNLWLSTEFGIYSFRLINWNLFNWYL